MEVEEGGAVVEIFVRSVELLQHWVCWMGGFKISRCDGNGRFWGYVGLGLRLGLRSRDVMTMVGIDRLMIGLRFGLRLGSRYRDVLAMVGIYGLAMGRK